MSAARPPEPAPSAARQTDAVKPAPRRSDPNATLDEQVRQAERTVALQDHRLQQALDDVTRQTRHVARTGGRALLTGAGVGLAAWLAWRVAHRGERRRRARREEPPPPQRRHHPAPSGWQRLLGTALLVAPLVVAPATPAARALDALRPGVGWPGRLLRLLRTALAWRARQAPPAAAHGPRGFSPAPPAAASGRASVEVRR